MHDSPSKGQAASVKDAVHVPQNRCEAERNHLIDDLAYLVVRQHRYEQRAAPANVPNQLTSTSTLNPGQKQGI